MSEPAVLQAASVVARSAGGVPSPSASSQADLQACLRGIGIDPGRPETLPLVGNDATVGTESELQAAVLGRREDVDLPRTIEASNYFADVLRRSAAGDLPKRTLSRLEACLEEHGDGVWENSWVWFPRRRLRPFASLILDGDLKADRARPDAGPRGDLPRFLFERASEEYLRIPISYLVKLALADAVDEDVAPPSVIRDTAQRLFGCFLNDNTSPETVSFHVLPLADDGGAATASMTRGQKTSATRGAAVAREKSLRFLLSHLLVSYANRAFGLAELGQQAAVFFSPHPPVRQRSLNRAISDAFYRELFISPCLSGWQHGEAKRDYMVLCHQVLSRSQLNAVAKLREAGILTRNLVVLPDTSNVSLANNSTHITLGSRALSAARADPVSGFTGAQEKQLADLVVKISEHFLPLFVGTYSAAPYRLGFADFHPEQVLGFLPHELDYTHLRMLWRRWTGKSKNRLLGRPLTPFGPEPMDAIVSRLFGLRGDFVPDFRLLDYPVALLSTARGPALDGQLGNEERLKRDLDDLGVFDARMALYLPLRRRAFDAAGFCGFEGRHYSLFPSLRRDLAPAAELQALITALAVQWVAAGRYSHQDIPDLPGVESERRQIFFGAAIGIPTFFVDSDTPNRLLRDIVSGTQRNRSSRRYAGYTRVYNLEYRLALLRLLRREGAGLVEAMGLGDLLDDLEQRLRQPAECSAAGRLLHGVLDGVLDGAVGRDPLRVPADDFNRAAETFYRDRLRRQYLDEALGELVDELCLLEADADEAERAGVQHILGAGSPLSFLRAVRAEVVDADSVETGGGPDALALRRLIQLLLIVEHASARRHAEVVR